MKKLLLLGLILSVLNIYAFAQERIITGKVFRKPNIPLTNVQVFQPNSHNFNYTDKDGVFHLIVNEKLEKNIIISLWGFNTKTIAIDSANSYYSIELTTDTMHIISEINGVERIERGTVTSNYEEQELLKKNTLGYFVRFDWMFNDFQSFKPLLGENNINLLNKFEAISMFGLALKNHRFSYGLGFGYLHSTDSIEFLDLNLYNYQYALHFGYDILDSRDFTITPMVRLTWHIFNLHNSDNSDKIPFEQYLTNKELDIKFNQLTGFAGCNFAYRLYGLRIGIYGGYIFKLNDKPWVYSQENYLTIDKKIDVKNFNFGINCILWFND